MKFRVKHRKLFYVPGMISLLLIPVLCMWFLYSRDYLKVYTAVNVALSDGFYKFNSSNPSKPIKIYPKRKIENFILNGDEVNNEIQLSNARKRIKQLFAENDSINAVKIILGKKTKYKFFVDILDALAQDYVPTYVVNDNYFFVVYFPPEHKYKKIKSMHPLGCGYGSANKEYWAEQDRKNARELFIKNIKHFWQIPVALFGIISLNIFMLIKFNKNRIYNQKSYI
ncbi:hypothetical protein [Flavobacterium sangjuense]|uniref:Uncharacterized protein n=1 Tax=Flavobacterium sangjuense TaxID=2518177 RepID=A0A4V1CCE1_9FLAO|nr:hypothetical protein [Flavobacterium sangjuense]QBZ99164.1 hypothetical protein GS03_02686 [Flavobacterium sangjuense]